MRAEHIQNSLVDAGAVRASRRAPDWIIPTIKVLLVSLDAVIAATSFAAAYYFRQGGSLIQPGRENFTWSTDFAPYGALILFVIIIRVLALRYYDLYRLRGEFSFFLRTVFEYLSQPP